MVHIFPSSLLLFHAAMTNETMLSNSEMFSLSLESMTDSLTNYNYTAIPYRYIYQYIQR